MSRECEGVNKELTEANERIEYLIEKYKEILDEYAKVCSGEGLGDYDTVYQIWLKEIE